MLQAVKVVPRETAMRHLLSHASFVDERHRIVYVETPKVACTSIKFMLRSLSDSRPLRFFPHSHASTASQRIHDRHQMPLRQIASFPRARQESIMNGPGWFRFCVVRHPYDRVFSAWRDKIFVVEPGYEKYQSDKTKKFVEFTDFVAAILTEDPYTCDVHWRAQVSLLLPDQMDYTHIYDMQNVSQIPADLEAHLEAAGASGNTLIMPRINESLPIASDHFMTQDIMASLRKFYDADFERFGFAEREAKISVGASAASLANEYSDAVYDRNRVLMDHVLRASRQRRLVRAAGVVCLALVCAAAGFIALSMVMTGGKSL